MRRTSEELSLRLGHEPTTAQLASELGLAIRQVEDLDALNSEVASLDRVESEEQGSLAESLAAGPEQSPEGIVGEQLRQEELRALLSFLSDAERQVICLRFGLGCQGHSIVAIAARLHMSRERVGRLEARALLKLRSYAHTRGWQSGMDL